MATDTEKLLVQLEANMRNFEKNMARAYGVTDKQTKAIERRVKTMTSRLDSMTTNFGRAALPSLGALGAALTTTEVIRYADAWTRAKNSLAVAGVTGKQQKQVLDQLFAAAQRNATPIEALTGLYGKAAQASDNLGASQGDLLRFSEGVAIALKAAGTDAGAASGALQQLGQLLGSARVQAEEFNSVNEGARPILQAVAAGLDEAGGSVNKLKELVNDGKVSGRQFFEAFLRGLPVVEQAASNATQTIAQGYTKVNNALTKFIGEQDSSLGATQRMVNALNYLADNFDSTADTALKLAGIIAAALVGRSIAGMIVKLGAGTMALAHFTRAMVAARSGAGLLAAMGATGGLGAAIGPIGAILGVAAAAALYFATSSDTAAESSETAASAADRYAAALQRVKGEAKGAGDAAAEAGRKFAETERNRLQQQLSQDRDLAERLSRDIAITSVTGGGDVSRGALGVRKKEIDAVADALGGSVEEAVKFQEAMNKAANDNPNFQSLADRLNPLLDKLIGIRKEIEDAADGLKDLARSPVSGTSLADAYRANAESRMPAARGQFIIDETKRQAGLTEEQKIKEDLLAELNKELADNTAALNDAEKARLVDQRFQERQTSRGSGKDQGFPDGAVSNFVNDVVGAESGGNRFAKNGSSSATGLGQFIESTWLQLFKENFPDRADGMTRAAILALRTDADVSKQLIEAYAKQNADVLRKAGVAVNDAALHLSHFLGAGDAVKVLSAASGTPLKGLISGSSIAANPTILGGGRTVDDAIAYANKRASGTRIAAGNPNVEEERAATLAELIASSKEYQAELARETEALNQNVYEQTRATELARLTNEAKQAGIELSPAVIAAFEAEAEAAGRAAQMAADSGEQLNQMNEARQFIGDGISSFFSDIITGSASAEDALKRLVNSLLDASLQALLLGQGPLAGLFGTAAPAGGVGGILGGLFKAIGFAEGGYTGMGGKNAPAGVVHKGEYVFDAKATRRIGVRNLEALRATAKTPGYASGGFVSGSIPSMPMLSRIPTTSAVRTPPVEVKIGVEANDYFDARVTGISRRQAQAGDARVVQGVNRGFPERSRTFRNNGT